MAGHSTTESEASADDFELSTLSRLPSLPHEVQDSIISFCDIPSLGVLCKLNRRWRQIATPHLWRNLNFPEAYDDNELIEATRCFFATCYNMIENSPARFETLSSYVQTLDVGRLHGLNILLYPYTDDCGDFPFFDEYEGRDRCVFDIIARFRNLESLSFYLKNWWGFADDKRNKCDTVLAEGLTKLRSLSFGGQMPDDVLKGLFAHPQNLTDLTLVNLHACPGQDDGPDGIVFLTKEICQNLKSLETLHLCKLGDLDGREDYDQEEDDGSDHEGPDYASGMRWPFPREAELDVLKEWQMLLQHTAGTLRKVTLENRFLCSYGFEKGADDTIDPGNKHPVDFGAFSIRESQRVLFPELEKQAWPRPEELTLVGMGDLDVANVAVAHMKDRVRVEQRLATIETMGGDATPEQISTPVEFAR